MANNGNKEQERAELHKTIWQIANDLRGSVDGWDFKTYVLGMLFYRFISENLTYYITSKKEKLTPISIMQKFQTNKPKWDVPIR